MRSETNRRNAEMSRLESPRQTDAEGSPLYSLLRENGVPEHMISYCRAVITRWARAAARRNPSERNRIRVMYYLDHNDPETIAKELGLRKNHVRREIGKIRHGIKKRIPDYALGRVEKADYAEQLRWETMLDAMSVDDYDLMDYDIWSGEVLNGFPETPIEELDFSVRTFNCLKRANINSLEDLIQKTEEEIRGLRNMGQKSLDEVNLRLAERGCSLRSFIIEKRWRGI